jgi:transitional endoplasmic reticulum ATPase
MEGTLRKGCVFASRYTVLFFIKKSRYAETYRVKGTDGKLYFLKLFHPGQIHYSAFDANGNLLEIELLKHTRHPNISGFRDRGETVVENRKILYLVLDFIAGETLEDRIVREPVSALYDIRQILSGVLNGLNYLHGLPEPVIHNEITPQNIMLDLSGETLRVRIIDFGYARPFRQSSKAYHKEGLNLQYVASECITAGVFSPQSDLFSVGVMMYRMLFGMLPWNVADSESNNDKLLEQRGSPLLFPDVTGKIVDFDESVLGIIKKALYTETEQRFQSAQEFLQALNGEITVGNAGANPSVRSDSNAEKRSMNLRTGRAHGFAAIAGMCELKEILQTDVINAIQNPEEYRLHNLGLPNGMLLYGPPGCGKTFFAERFAEETGYNFIKVVASDIASVYVHGTQEKVGKLFDEARKNAPTILYFDELDAMTPNR